MILIFKREKLSKVVVNKPYEVRFDFLVVLVFYFHVFWRVRASCTISNIQYSKIPTSAGFPENFLLPASALASQQRCCSSRKLVILWLVSSCHCFGHCFCCFFFQLLFLKKYQAIHVRPCESCHLTRSCSSQGGFIYVAFQQARNME